MTGKVMKGGPAPKGGGSIVSTTRNASVMAQSKGQSAVTKGANIAKASTPTGSKPQASGGSVGGMPSIHSTHTGTKQAGDAGSGVGGGRKLGTHYSNS